jgi:hypothetical protein
MQKHLSKENAGNPEALKANLHYIDFPFLYDLVMENGEFLKRIITQFLKQFPGEMESLKEAVDKRDKKLVANLAHHIQSTVSVLGKNTPFFLQLEKIEKMAGDGATPAQLITEHIKLEDYKQYLLKETEVLMQAELP